jgi:uncharacterized protein
MGDPHPPPPPGRSPYGPGGLTPAQERTWATAAHWSALVAGLLGGLAFLGPLLVLLVKGDQSPMVRHHAMESLNFQLSMLIYAIVSAVLMLVLVGFVLLPVVAVVWLVLTVVGAVRANSGEPYRYPLTIRMIS